MITVQKDPPFSSYASSSWWYLLIDVTQVSLMMIEHKVLGSDRSVL